MNLLRTTATLALAVILSACAHPIMIGADTVPERVESKLIQKRVAYSMNEEERARQVTSPGGGGDKVSYYPYRDMEKSIRDVLRSVYQDVVVIKSIDTAAVKESGAVLVFAPTIKTSSSSPSMFTWPPTLFSTEVACVVTDALGAEVTRVSAVGNGAAEFSEFKGEFGLSGKRASNDLAKKLGDEIRANVKLR